MSDLVYILEAKPYDPVSGTLKTINFSKGLLSEGDLPDGNGQPYPVRLDQAFNHETSIFDDNIPGNTNVSVGSAVVNNTDGRFDFLLDYSWDSREVVIKRGEVGKAYSTYTTEFVGSVLELTADSRNLNFALRDNSYKLMKPFQPNKYSGGGGANGGVDLREKQKPLLFGKVLNLSPVWIDQILLISQINDGAITSVEAVYDRANKLDFHANYATYALLAAADIPPGRYATSLATGLIRLGAPPEGALTADATGPTYGTSNLPELARQVMYNMAGLVDADIDDTSFTTAGASVNYPFQGIYFQTPDFQHDTFLETIASAVNGYWCFARNGQLTFGLFKFSTPVATIRAEDIMSLGKAASPAPVHRLRVNYSKNPTIIDPSEFVIPRQTLNGYLTRRYHYVNTSGGEAGADYSGAGQFKVFLNETQVNDLEQVQFRVRDGETWLSIDPLGNITVTNPGAGVSNVSAVLRANLGEFFIDETFTLVEDAVAPYQNLIMTLSSDRFYFNDAGQPSPTSQVITITQSGSSVGTPVTYTAVDNLGQNVAITGGNTISIASVSRSPLVFWIDVTGTDTAGIVQKRKIIVQKGSDAYAAGVLGALSAANKAITIFYQDGEPTSPQIDDVWVDTNDSNKMYRWTGSAWAIITDTRIIDALNAAAGAQATADGRVRTYFTSTAPVQAAAPNNLVLGDLWYNPSTGLVLRWDGSGWGNTFATRNVFRGNWAASTAYAVGDTFLYTGTLWQVNTAHTSSAGAPPPNANVQATTATSLAELDAVADAQLDAATQQIADSANDGLLTPQEKITTVLPTHRSFSERTRVLLASAASVLYYPTNSNMVLQSEDLATSWTKANCTISANIVPNPLDGAQTADAIVYNGAGGGAPGVATSGITLVSGTQYSGSFFFKKGSSYFTHIQFYLANMTDVLNYRWAVNLDTQDLDALNKDNLDKFILEPYPDGWYRATFVFTSPGSDPGTLNVYLTVGTSLAGLDIAKSGEYGYLWGAQLGPGSGVLPYEKTTTTALNRVTGTLEVNDVASAYRDYLDVLTAAYDDWYNTSLTSSLTPTQNLHTSTDLMTWAVNGTPTRVKNGGWTTIGDDDATLHEGITRNINIISGRTYTLQLKIKKDSVPATTRFATLRLQFTGGTSRIHDLRFNTQDGSYLMTSVLGIVDGRLVDRGDYWLAYITATAQSDNTVAFSIFYPALGTSVTFASYVVTTVGSVDVKDLVFSEGTLRQGGRRSLVQANTNLNGKLDALAGAIRSVRVSTQWSSDGLGGSGASAWHDTYVAGQDFWMRQSNDNGATWGTPVKAVGESGTAGVSATSAWLTNEATVLVADKNGVVAAGEYTASGFTYMKVYVGATDDTANWSFTASPVSSGSLTYTLNNTVGHVDRGRLAVTNMTADSGFVDITAAKTGYTSITKRFRLAKAKGGVDSIVGVMTNEVHATAANADGTGYSLTNAGGTFKVNEGTVDKTGALGSSPNGYFVNSSGTLTSVAQNGLTFSIASTGIYTLSGASWSTDSETFIVRAIYNGVTITKSYTITKVKVGANISLPSLRANRQTINYQRTQGSWDPRPYPAAQTITFTVQVPSGITLNYVDWYMQRASTGGNLSTAGKTANEYLTASGTVTSPSPAATYYLRGTGATATLTADNFEKAHADWAEEGFVVVVSVNYTATDGVTRTLTDAVSVIRSINALSPLVVKASASSLNVVYDGDGNVDTSQPAVGLLAQVQNSDSPAIWQMYESDGKTLIPNPTTYFTGEGTPLGNQLLWNCELNNAVWTTANFAAADKTIAAPDGSMTATNLTTDDAGTSAVNHYIRQDFVTGTVGSNWNESIYVKRNSTAITSLQLRAYDVDHAVNLVTLNFDLVTGVITSYSGTTIPQVEKLNNGWYRIGFHFDAPAPISPATTTNMQFYLYFGDANSNTTAQFPVGSSIYVWQPMVVNQATFYSPYETQGTIGGSATAFRETGAITLPVTQFNNARLLSADLTSVILRVAASDMSSTNPQPTSFDQLTLVKTQHGTDGNYRQFVFKRSLTTPLTPTDTTGPVPSGASPNDGWFDSPPADDGNFLWQSSAELTHNDVLVGAWSTPVRVDPPGAGAWTAVHKNANTVDRNGRIDKIGVANSWTDAGVYSAEAYVGGVTLSFKALTANKNLMIGINADALPLAINYTQIDYAWYLLSDGSMNIRENGTSKFTPAGTYIVGDRFSITSTQGVVRYYKNGALIYTSLVNPSLTLAYRIDSALNTSGASIGDISFVGSGQTGLTPDVKFIRQNATPATPNSIVLPAAGGTTQALVNAPAGWSDGIPAGTDRLWQIRGNKNGAGNLVGQWSPPQQISGITYRGDWTSGTVYYVNDSVAYNGGSYVATVQNTAAAGNAPSGTSAANATWDVLIPPAVVPPAGGGDLGTSAAYTTITIPSQTGPVNLRALADAAGYGAGNAYIQFTVTGNVTGGSGGKHGIDTGTWPTGKTISLRLTINTGVTVAGGGGEGGRGGGYGGLSGNSGGSAGHAINLQVNMNSITVSGTGIIAGGGGGGGGGNGEDVGFPGEPMVSGGNGGGGGYPNGLGGAAGSGDPGSASSGANGTTAGGGAAGGTGAGAGGGRAAAGASGDGGGGAAGAALKKNGKTVTTQTLGTVNVNYFGAIT